MPDFPALRPLGNRRGGVRYFASRDSCNHNGGADSIGGALLTLGTFGHSEPRGNKGAAPSLDMPCSYEPNDAAPKI